jgi:hypothetical protein
VEQQKSERQIAEGLNSCEITGEDARPWTRATVHQILTNPKYIGANIYNRRSFKLKRKRVKNPLDMWIWRNDAFQPIVNADQFYKSKEIIESRHRHLSDEELLDRLRILLQHCGRLSGILIDESEDMPSSSCYCSRFGSLPRAYELIGWTPKQDFAYIEINRRLRRKHADLVSAIVGKLQSLGATVEANPRNDLLTINAEYTASLVLARCRESSEGNRRWLIRLDTSLHPDVMIAARLQPGNEEILDYYLLPSMDILTERLHLRQENGVVLDVYRFDNLNFFMEMARRVRIEGDK